MMMDDPLPIDEPLPQPPAYHLKVPPDPPLALSVTCCPGHAELGLALALLGAEGLGFTVNVVDAHEVFPHVPSTRT